jgi:hypothetical protein
LRTRARAILQWFIVDPWPVWVPLALLLVSLRLPCSAEFQVRTAGYVIGMAGVWLVVKDLGDKRIMFGRPGALERVGQWLKRFPSLFLPTKVVSATAHAASLAASLAATGDLRAALTTREPTLEERVAVLEWNHRRLSDRLDAAEIAHERDMRLLRHADATEAAAREEAVRRLHERVEELSVGGLVSEWAGVAWVVVGNTLATFSKEAAGLI